jgi:tetratricopeptide (TPR) repeat protein
MMSRSCTSSIALLAVLLTAATACSRDPERAKRGYLERGNRYFQQKKYREAIVEYRNVLRLDPRSGEARRQLATSYLQTGDPLNALREQVRAADLLPGDVRVQVGAGNMLLLIGRFEDAKARANQALTISPKDLPAQILLGNAYAGLKEFDSAITEIEEALKLDPERTTTYANLGTLQLIRGDRKAAEQTFREAVARHPSSVSAQLALASFHWATGNTKEAESLIRTSVQTDPRDLRTNRAMANILLATKRVADAEPYLRTAADVDPSPVATIALADYYIVAGQTDKASTLLQGMKVESAWATMVKLRLANIEYRAGRAQEAERLADEILAADKTDVSTLLLKANLLTARGQLEEADRVVQVAVGSNPRSARAHFALGKLNILRRRPEEAKKAFIEALNVNPRAAEAQIELARLHLADGAAEKSLEFANLAVKNNPSNADAYFTQARALIARREIGQAEPILDRLRTTYPKSAAVYSQLGIVKAMKKDYAGAARMFEQSLTLDPDQLDATAGLVGLDLVGGRKDAARTRTASRIARTPNDANVLLFAGRTYAAMGDTKQAEESFKKVLEVDALNLGSYEGLGRLYIRLGRLPEAQKEFEALAARQARPAGSLTMVGMIQQSRNLSKEARATYEQVLQHDPQAAVAANNLAWLYAEEGVNIDLALQLAQTAKAGLPKNAEANDTLGWIYYRKGLLSPAIREFEEAVQRDPLNPIYQYHLGMAYAKNGNRDDARRALGAALRLNPDFSGSNEARTLLASL